MILLPFASGKTYGVLGLGTSGRATVASLLASGARVIGWDDGEAGPTAAQKEFSALQQLSPEQWDFGTLAALIVSPGIFLSHPAVVAAKAAGVEVIGDIELLFRAQPNAWYVCITGTNGKSTTTTLIAHILSACGKRVEVGGNLGTPALALAPLDASGIYVLELSSYQLDLVTTTHFNVGVLLNLSPDHLDHHGSMEHYIAAKLHIFDRMTATDVAVVGVDDAESTRIAESLTPMQVVRISGTPSLRAERSNPANTSGLLRSARNDGRFTVEDIAAVKSLQGAHNHQNAAASYAACVACGCTHEAIIAAMQTYPGLAHRMEWLGEIHGVQYVNDSKATNADAAEKALLTYDDIYWILGGVAKEGGIEPLAPYFAKIRHAYLIGEASDDFAQTLEGKVAYTRCGTLENAFAAAKNAAEIAASQHANAAPCVLLSPACASFDQFANFEVRGAAFVKLVEALRAGHHDAA